MSDEVRELSLQLYLPLYAMGLVFANQSVAPAGLKAIEIIDCYHLYDYLDTKNNKADFVKLLDDPTALNERCRRQLIRHYFLQADGQIVNDELCSWLCAKGIALMYRYSDDDSYLHQLIDHVKDHLAIGKNVIDMLSKDRSYKDMRILAQLIAALCDADSSLYKYRLIGLSMLKRAHCDTYDYCDLANTLVYGLLSVNGHKDDLLKKAQSTLDEIEKLMSGRHENENDVQLYAKIKSNQGACAQARYKLFKNHDDIALAIECHKEALNIRLSADLPTIAQSLMTLASDYYYVYDETHQAEYLKTSLDYHLKAYKFFKDSDNRYKNLIRIAGVRIELAKNHYDEENLHHIYDDLGEALILAQAANDRHECRNIQEHFKDALEVSSTHACSAEMYNKIYHLAQTIDQEDGYLCDLVKRKL